VSKARVFGSCDACVLLLGCDDGDGSFFSCELMLRFFGLCCADT
jgi:hypothetical protein